MFEPQTLILIYIAGMALIVGSFLNMALARFHTGKSWNGRSQCMTCNHTLAWYDLVPLVSFVTLRGRCRYCGVAMGIRYLIVELMMLVWALSLFVAVGWGWPFMFLFIIGALLIFIIFYDMRHMIIPDTVVGLLVLVTLVAILSLGWSAGYIYDPIFGNFILDRLIALVAIPLPFFILWVISGGRVMGLGDIKMMAWMGLSLGLFGGIEALVMGFWVGGIVGMIILAMRGAVSVGLITSPRLKATLAQSEIPFGPFLATGYIAYVLGFHFLGILL
ncbi:prepilin peptidase [Candidatus Nomurabacteria bacterium]|nr:prepilin peptidase [Candidatus Nomurabacteria bacterium]